jgi:hypothetical protein
MSAAPTRLTDDDRRKLIHIPDSVETRAVWKIFYLIYSYGVYLQTITFVKTFGIDRKEVHIIKGS